MRAWRLKRPMRRQHTSKRNDSFLHVHTDADANPILTELSLGRPAACRRATTPPHSPTRSGVEGGRLPLEGEVKIPENGDLGGDGWRRLAGTSRKLLHEIVFRGPGV